MKSRILAFILLCGLGGMLPINPAAADNATALRSLNKLQILLDKATMAYQMLNLDNGNPTYSQAVDKTVGRIDKLRGDYVEAADKAKLQTDLKKLSGDVDGFLKALKSNQQKISHGGYEEYAVVNDMYNNKIDAQKTISSMYSTIEKVDKVKVEAPVQECRDLSALLQQMASAYIEGAASVSGSAMRSNGNKPIDKMAREFSARLAKLNITSDKVPSIGIKLSEVKNKWAFIEDSMINYKQNTVPYLVYRYADTMVDDLLDIAELYETRNQANIQAPTFGPPKIGGAPLPPGIPPAPKGK